MTEQEISDEEAILRLASAMKENAPTPEDKQSVHSFLFNVVIAPKTTKVGNLRDDKEINELGIPPHTVRGCFDMARISRHIMGNDYFEEWFICEAEDVLSTSLSREGFLVKQATTQTKQVADVTRRKKVNKGWFSKKEETTGGDTTSSSS